MLPVVLGALAITLAIFLFMQSLIAAGKREQITLTVYKNVQVLRPAPEKEKPDKADDAPQQVSEEPLMDALSVAPPTPQTSPKLEIPALDLAVGDISIAAVGDSFNAPLGTDVVSVVGGGQDASGFIEVVPFNTRRPNVPEVAWQNKIDGWVLVAFSVTPAGNTRDVRVLDARPRGVFEEKVIAAVKDWNYTVKFAGAYNANVVLTQKVPVSWRDYVRNLPNVD